VQLGRKSARHAHKRYGRPLIEIRRKLGARTPGPIATGADDDIGAAYCEGFDPQCGEDLEISRGPLRSRNAPGP